MELSIIATLGFFLLHLLSRRRVVIEVTRLGFKLLIEPVRDRICGPAVNTDNVLSDRSVNEPSSDPAVSSASDDGYG